MTPDCIGAPENTFRHLIARYKNDPAYLLTSLRFQLVRVLTFCDFSRCALVCLYAGTFSPPKRLSEKKETPRTRPAKFFGCTPPASPLPFDVPTRLIKENFRRNFLSRLVSLSTQKKKNEINQVSVMFIHIQLGVWILMCPLSSQVRRTAIPQRITITHFAFRMCLD